MSIQEIAIWIVLIVAGLCLLMMLLFGIRGATYGKVSIMTMVAIAIPAVLLLGLGFAMDDWPTAAIYTLVITLGIAAFSMVASSFKGLFT